MTIEGQKHRYHLPVKNTRRSGFFFRIRNEEDPLDIMSTQANIAVPRDDFLILY